MFKHIVVGVDGREGGRDAVALARRLVAMGGSSRSPTSLRARRPRIFVSGPTAVVGRAADLLVQLGHEPVRIRVEDVGPMGG